MSYDICLYFRHPKTWKIQNPYSDEYSEEDELAPDQDIIKRNTDIATLISEKYPDIFSLGEISPSGDVYLLNDEWKKDYGMNIEVSQNLLTFYITFADIQIDEKSREELIRDIVEMVVNRYDCIIDDPQIGTIYIPTRLFPDLKNDFEWVEIIEFKDKGDIYINETSFHAWVKGLKKIWVESDIPDAAKTLIDNLKDTIDLNFSNEWLWNLILVLQDLHDTVSAQKDVTLTVQLCGSFLWEHIRKNFGWVKWKYGESIEDSVIQFFEWEKIIHEISPYKEVRNIIQNGNAEKNIQKIYTDIHKAAVKNTPFWRKIIFWQIIFGICLVVSLTVKYYKGVENLENTQKYTPQHRKERQIKDYQQVTLTLDSITKQITRPSDMSEYKTLTWEIRDSLTDEHLLSRLSQESTYTYYNNQPGKSYEVYLMAFNGKENVKVSNTIQYIVE